MTATCTLCKKNLSVVPDLRGSDYTLGAFGHLFKQHLEKEHKTEPQTAFHPSIMQCSVPQMLGAGQVSAVIGILVQGAILFSYLKSEDAEFIEKVSQMKQLVIKAIDQKEVLEVKIV